MADRKGHTLLEIVFVLVIIGALAAFVVPNVFVSIERTKAQSAQNNLLVIAAAQSKYDGDYGYYCVTTSAPPCDNTTDIDSSLKLTISDSFSYSCSSAAVSPYYPYTCTATDNVDTLTLSASSGGSGQPQISVTCVNAGGHSSYCPA